MTNPVTVKTYDARGLLVSLLDPAANETTWAYNGLGLAKSETNELLDARTTHPVVACGAAGRGRGNRRVPLPALPGNAHPAYRLVRHHEKK